MENIITSSIFMNDDFWDRFQFLYEEYESQIEAILKLQKEQNTSLPDGIEDLIHGKPVDRFQKWADEHPSEIAETERLMREADPKLHEMLDKAHLPEHEEEVMEYFSPQREEENIAKLVDMMAGKPGNYEKNADIQTSYSLGQAGQLEIESLLHSVFPRDEIVDPSKSGHFGDYSVEHAKKLYMFEVKNKQNITKEDVEKFKSDAQNYDISFFLSLKTNHIPLVDFIELDDHGKIEIYLQEQFVKKEVIHSIVNCLGYVKGNVVNAADTSAANKVPDNTTILLESELIVATQSHLNSELKVLDSLLEQQQVHVNALSTVGIKIQAQRMVVQKLIQIGNTYQDVDFEKNEQEQDIINYIKSTPKQKILKSVILEKGDKLQLGKYTKEELIVRFLSLEKAVVENNTISECSDSYSYSCYSYSCYSETE